MSILNRYEFMFYVACINSNPNGDPDMGNTPRIDPETMQGFITDGAIKRRIRNYVYTAYEGEPGMDIMIQPNVNLNRRIAEAKQMAGEDINAKTKEAIYNGRKAACQMYYDVRAFGAVMSTGPNAGQVRGPVQITFGKSVDPVLPMDVSITRMAVSDGNFESVEEYIEDEQSRDSDKLRTIGRKQIIPFGLYEVRGFISANLAAETGFDDNDLNIMFESILNMYEHDRSASKGEMSVVSPLIIFKHVGTDSDENQRVRQAKLGCAAAHKLFSLVSVKKKPEVEYPRTYTDYTALVHMDKLPAGVEIGFRSEPYGDIIWGALPENEEWFHLG